MNTPVSTLLHEKGITVYHARPDTTVRDAVRQMNDHHVGALVVTRGERPVGMFTERDVLMRIVAAGLDPDSTPVEAVMSRRLTVIRPETTVDEAMAIITRERHRHLPVVDADKRLVGMISIGDLMRWIVRDEESRIQNLNEYIWGGNPS
ncbi:MAG: CBS domain-containing protein [Opitutaceae bacterium]|nr:CBS domain-containing protein [Opitutaceae bacterium]